MLSAFYKVVICFLDQEQEHQTQYIFDDEGNSVSKDTALSIR
jgi:hypothetical protein